MLFPRRASPTGDVAPASSRGKVSVPHDLTACALGAFFNKEKTPMTLPANPFSPQFAALLPDTTSLSFSAVRARTAERSGDVESARSPTGNGKPQRVEAAKPRRRGCVVVVLPLILVLSGIASGVAPLRADSSEDVKLRELYRDANYTEIVKRYRSAGRVRNLSPEGLALLVNALIPDHAGELLTALTPIVSDDDLANLALQAAIRGKHIDFSDVGVRRLNRTRTGRVALALNGRALPPAPAALAQLRAARLTVLERFFFSDATPDARAEALRALVMLTTDAFKNNRFSADVPPPPAEFAPKDLTDLALKLSLLPYLDEPTKFVSSIRTYSNGSSNGASR